MNFVADFHIHSKYSRATSKQMNLENLYKWAQIKGINVIGTGDFTHPEWLNELQEKLEPAEEGLYRLKEKYIDEKELLVPKSCKSTVRFILTSEISCIYSKNGKTRKVHQVIVAPNFVSIAKINSALHKIGNLSADGRPILGLESKNLLKIALEANPEIIFIPAHIWTPHFAVFGANSGFDSLEECFEELTSEIFAVETGLSSDPEMNWKLSQLDNITLVSNSDAHSPQKLGREANLFNTDLSYPSIKYALKECHPDKFLGTIEFYPEKGKYHFDGHRICKQRLSPKETTQFNNLCPVCGKPVTVGVLHRVEKLADKDSSLKGDRARPFKKIIPLAEIIAETLNSKSTSSKKVTNLYDHIIHELGNEFSILINNDLDDIKKAGNPLLAEAIHRVREGNVHIQPGYDGEYGTVKIFKEEEREAFSDQMAMF